MSSEPFVDRPHGVHSHPHHEHSSHAEPQPHAGPPPHAQMMQIMFGMWVTQIASAVGQLGVADLVAKGKVSVDELAAECGANPEALYRLLRAAAAIGLVGETAPRHFALTPVGETLRSDAPNSMLDILIAETMPGHWLPWGRLADAVRHGGSVSQEILGTELWKYYADNPEEGRRFARGMGNLSAIASQEVAHVFDPGDAACIIDVGGSEGVLLRGFLSRLPNARGILFDRPEIADVAKNAIAASGFAERVDVVGGDFFADVPAGGDLYLLKHVLHDWPDDKCDQILRNIHRAAAPGSRLLVIEMLLPDGPGPSPVPLMDINMLVMVGGRERTAAEYAEMLGHCGYAVERIVPTPGVFHVIEARRV
jgi:hypothetical protein